MDSFSPTPSPATSPPTSPVVHYDEETTSPPTDQPPQIIDRAQQRLQAISQYWEHPPTSTPLSLRIIDQIVPEILNLLIAQYTQSQTELDQLPESASQEDKAPYLQLQASISLAIERTLNNHTRYAARPDAAWTSFTFEAPSWIQSVRVTITSIDELLTLARVIIKRPQTDGTLTPVNIIALVDLAYFPQFNILGICSPPIDGPITGKFEKPYNKLHSGGCLYVETFNSNETRRTYTDDSEDLPTTQES